MLSVFCVNMTTIIKDQYGLVGFPLEHSFSEKFFTDKFDRENIAATYSNFEISNIDSIVKILADNKHLKGLNITIPYKQDILRFLTNLSEEAEEIGAVNTIKILRDENDNPIINGYNTDAMGFRNSIEPLITSLFKNKDKLKALVLGTGGASKAVTFVFKQLDVPYILISRKKNEAANVLSYSDLNEEIILGHKIIINCTPLGTFPNIDTCPNIPYDFITKDHLAYDLVYNPSETLFLNKSKQKGATTKNGHEMLKNQALGAWEIWKN